MFQVISQVQFNLVHLGPLLQWTHHQDIVLWEPCFTPSVCDVTCLICLNSVVLGTTLGNTISGKHGFTGHNFFICDYEILSLFHCEMLRDFVVWTIKEHFHSVWLMDFFCLPTYYLECTTKLKAVCSITDDVVNGTKFSSTFDVSTIFDFSTLS